MMKRPSSLPTGSITDSATLGDYNTPAPENPDYGAASSLWKQATEHFYNLGNPR